MAYTPPPGHDGPQGDPYGHNDPYGRQGGYHNTVPAGPGSGRGLPAWVIPGGAVIAILLLGGGVSLLVSGDDKPPQPPPTTQAASPPATPQPTPTPTSTPAPTQVSGRLTAAAVCGMVKDATLQKHMQRPKKEPKSARDDDFSAKASCQWLSTDPRDQTAYEDRKLRVEIEDLKEGGGKSAELRAKEQFERDYRYAKKNQGKKAGFITNGVYGKIRTLAGVGDQSFSIPTKTTSGITKGLDVKLEFRTGHRVVTITFGGYNVPAGTAPLEFDKHQPMPEAEANAGAEAAAREVAAQPG